jgi:hypothetical protein
VISPTQRPLTDKTQHSQETDIHASGGIRTHNPSKREAADPCLRPRGNRDLSSLEITQKIQTNETVHTSIQAINDTFNNRSPIFHVFREVHTTLTSKYSSLQYKLKRLKTDKVQFESELRRYCRPSYERTNRRNEWSDNADCPAFPNYMCVCIYIYT